ncbi:MAG: ComEC/Rec2 family competence protein, partial [Rhodospirillales bacterium]
VCWAAIVILLFRPESLVEPGFQMSFAAVTALIAAYAWLSRRRRLKPRSAERSTLGKCMGYLGSVLLTTVVAGAATAPFAVYHFQHVSVFGMITNAIAVPLAALWVMPAGIATLLAMPFGWDAAPLAVMCFGIDGILASADLFAGLPGAAADISAPPAWSLGLCTLAGLWLSLWQTRLRYYAVPVLALAFFSPNFGQAPDMIIDGDARTIAVNDGLSGLRTSNGRAARFEVATWQRRLGYSGKPLPWQDSAEHMQGRLRCDANGCSVAIGSRHIAIALNETTLHEDCQRSDMLVAMVPVRGRCRPPWGIIDRFDLWRDGTHSIRFSDAGPVILTVNGERGARPWVIAPK